MKRLTCTATLQKRDLWEKFHELDTEMIITKSGRRMFPAIRVQLYQLDPLAHYCVLLEMVQVGKCRYKYSASNGWTPAGAEEAQSHKRVYLHPESPATGEHWMSQVISFGRLKLTNTISPPNGHLVLSSMHKYLPTIIVVESMDPMPMAWSPTATIAFMETQFIAVTAYQNEKITKLKIDHNPFAKGFRESGHSKCKRKKQQSQVQRESISDKRQSESPKIDVVSDEGSSTGTSSPELQHIEPIPLNRYVQPHFDYYGYPFRPFYSVQPYYFTAPYAYNPLAVYPNNRRESRSSEESNARDVTRRLTDFSIESILNS